MSTRNLLRHSCLLALIAAPLAASAAPSTDPLFTFGLLGSYDKFKFEGGSESETDHLGQGGLFANYGNKMTAESGFIYQIGADAKYGKKVQFFYVAARGGQVVETVANAQIANGYNDEVPNVSRIILSELEGISMAATMGDKAPFNAKLKPIML